MSFNQNQLFYPLKSLEQVYTLLYLSSKYHLDVELSSLTLTFNTVMQTQFNEQQLLFTIKKFYSLMATNEDSFFKLTESLEEKISQNKIIICEAPFLNCKYCKDALINTRKSNCLVFTLSGPKPGLLRSKYCKNCLITYNTDTFIKDGSS
jgi:hypothetical protein